MVAGSGWVLAQVAVDRGLGGWWVGVAIGSAVVIVVAAVVLSLILLARRITRQAGMAVAALDAATANTHALWELEAANRSALAILEGAIRARETLENAP